MCLLLFLTVDCLFYNMLIHLDSQQPLIALLIFFFYFSLSRQHKLSDKKPKQERMYSGNPSKSGGIKDNSRDNNENMDLDQGQIYESVEVGVLRLIFCLIYYAYFSFVANGARNQVVPKSWL